jgi:hypothetical protein
LRLDHLQFTNIDSRALVVGYNTWATTNGPIYGLIDHIQYNSTTCPEGFALVYGNDLDAWRGDDRWGTANALYIEDSVFNWNITTNMGRLCTIADGEHGARIVVRYNIINNAMELGHDTGGTQQSRGQRIREVYSNTFTCTVTDGDCGGPAIDFRGGSQMVYDNAIPIFQSSMIKGYGIANYTEIWRVDHPEGSDPWNYGVLQTAKNVANDFRSHCTGNRSDSGFIPFVACGANELVGQSCVFPGSGTCENNPVDNAHLPPGVFILSNIDGGGSGGYPARDQVGQGKDWGGYSPLGLIQTLTPAYWWNNIDSNTGAQLTTLNVAPSNCVSYPSNCYIRADRDVYMNIGRGSSLPSGNCTPVAGYWYTGTNTLYRCTNMEFGTWTPYYTPFTYPHPLQAN